MNINADILEKLATFTGILAGFSLTTAVALLLDKKNITKVTCDLKLKTFTITILFCTTLLLVEVVISAEILSNRLGLPRVLNANQDNIFYLFTNITLLLFALGIFLFFTGTALASWIWNEFVGILVSSIAFVSFVLVVIIFLFTP